MKVSHVLIVIAFIQINAGTSITSHAILKTNLGQANEFLVCN
jgi:hypothetical protein